MRSEATGLMLIRLPTGIAEPLGIIGSLEVSRAGNALGAE